MAEPLNVAFKEWAVVDEALGAGRQSILIRKGGIHERHGKFEVEHDEFLIYPTYLHQSADMLKPGVAVSGLRPQSPVQAPQSPDLPHQSTVVAPQSAAQAPQSLGLAPPSPQQVTIRHLARVVEVFRAGSEDGAAAWDSWHIYSPQLIQSRFRYKPERPLYVLLVHILRLASPVSFAETPAYAGCRSWVTLDSPVDTAGARPVIDDARFASLARDVRTALPHG